jgi:hypothetical protein
METVRKKRGEININVSIETFSVTTKQILGCGMNHVSKKKFPANKSGNKYGTETRPNQIYRVFE